MSSARREIKLRLPSDLLGRLVTSAEASGRSLNGEMVALLGLALDCRTLERLATEIAKVFADEARR